LILRPDDGRVGSSQLNEGEGNFMSPRSAEDVGNQPIGLRGDLCQQRLPGGQLLVGRLPKDCGTRFGGTLRAGRGQGGPPVRAGLPAPLSIMMDGDHREPGGSPTDLLATLAGPQLISPRIECDLIDGTPRLNSRRQRSSPGHPTERLRSRAHPVFPDAAATSKISHHNFVWPRADGVPCSC